MSIKNNNLRARMVYYSEDNSGIKTKKSFHKSYTKNHVNLFFDWQHRFLALSPTSISLLFFLAEEMDDYTNEITHNKTTIRRYQEFRKKIGRRNCSVAAVRKGFQQLKKNHVLISAPEKGGYIVNPVYLYKENDECRRHCLNRLLENTKDINWSMSNLRSALGL